MLCLWQLWDDSLQQPLTLPPRSGSPGLSSRLLVQLLSLWLDWFLLGFWKDLGLGVNVNKISPNLFLLSWPMISTADWFPGVWHSLEGHGTHVEILGWHSNGTWIVIKNKENFCSCQNAMQHFCVFGAVSIGMSISVLHHAGQHCPFCCRRRLILSNVQLVTSSFMP